ncbi:hypothetical protein GCM10029992_14340 [Glycomyces albus]
MDGHKALNGINTSMSEIEDLTDWPAMVMAVDAIIEKSNASHAAIEQFEQGGSNHWGDPLQLLAGTLVDFVIDLCKPLKDILGLVTGNEGRMKTSVEMWLTVVQGGMETGSYIAETGAEALKDWQGRDADAARKRIGEIGQAISVMSMWGVAISIALRGMAWLAKKCEAKVKELLATLVKNAITKWLPGMASGAATFGSTSAATVTLAIVEVANKIITALNLLMMAITLCKLIWEVFAGVLEQIPGIQSVLNFFKQ